MRFGYTFAIALLLSACGGKSDLGEKCDGIGSAENCVDGTICTNAADGNGYCRQSCTQQSDCPAGTNCNGISNTTAKSCQ